MSFPKWIFKAVHGRVLCSWKPSVWSVVRVQRSLHRNNSQIPLWAVILKISGRQSFSGGRVKLISASGFNQKHFSQFRSWSPDFWTHSRSVLLPGLFRHVELAYFSMASLGIPQDFFCIYRRRQNIFLQGRCFRGKTTSSGNQPHTNKDEEGEIPAAFYPEGDLHSGSPQHQFQHSGSVPHYV